ncbi:ABC transporter permease [uncultured Alsobacter sp.]|uniref:ABC transporter permease n=1 Tax=uncultured Alsobacter sp. TaxID=1748258 RepID=UPI0025F300AC|nr:ABC transporter permease [uncultured Alsobacter sp.]
MTTEALALPRSRAGGRIAAGIAQSKAVAVLAIVALIVLAWYAAVYPMNADLPSMPKEVPFAERFAAAYALDRPVLPAPHQVIAELWKTTVETRATSPRSLLFHGWVTLSSTLVGFALGSLLGIVLAIGIVSVKPLEKSLLPWIIASQTIPILAVAPIVIVVLGSIGLTGLVPKAIISMYLCFFPVTIGMVKGFTSPDTMQLDLMRTYSASGLQTFAKLRWPASVPFLFASLKVAVAISLVGAIVGELPTGAQAGLGARLLSGSYYGQTVQIWSALFASSILASGLVLAVALIERVTMRLMGARP